MPHETEIAATIATLEAVLVRLEALAVGRDDKYAARIETVRDHLIKAAHELRALADVTPPPLKSATLVGRMIHPGIRSEAFRTRVTLKATAKPAQSEPPTVISAAEPAAPVAPAADDLTRIRGIDKELSAKLKSIGLTSFAGLAAMRGEDVRRVSEHLGIGRQISRQNWIEQAALLGRAVDVASVTEIAVPERVVVAVVSDPAIDVEVVQALQLAESKAEEAEIVFAPVATPDAVELAASPSPSAVGRESALPVPALDRLDLIEGINAHTLVQLNAIGITAWSAIAAWRQADIDYVEAMLGAQGVVARQNWIEQAALLTAKGLTAHAKRVMRGRIDIISGAEREPERLRAPLLERLASRPLAPEEREALSLRPVATLLDAIREPTSPTTVELAPALAAGALEPVEPVELVEPVAAAAVVAEPMKGVESLPVEAQANPIVTFEPQPIMAPAHMDALELELAALIANDAIPVVMPAEQDVGSERRGDVSLEAEPHLVDHKAFENVEDEEFGELLVEEADVMIVQRRHPAPRSQPALPLVRRTRSLISRLTRIAPLDDIDPANYAGYREHIEEAKVEIVKRGQGSKEAARES